MAVDSSNRFPEIKTHVKQVASYISFLFNTFYFNTWISSFDRWLILLTFTICTRRACRVDLYFQIGPRHKLTSETVKGHSPHMAQHGWIYHCRAARCMRQARAALHSTPYNTWGTCGVVYHVHVLHAAAWPAWLTLALHKGMVCLIGASVNHTAQCRTVSPVWLWFDWQVVSTSSLLYKVSQTSRTRIAPHWLLIALHNDRNSHKRGRQRAVPAYKTHPQLLIFAAVKKSAPYTWVFTVITLVHWPTCTYKGTTMFCFYL